MCVLMRLPGSCNNVILKREYNPECKCHHEYRNMILSILLFRMASSKIKAPTALL